MTIFRVKTLGFLNPTLALKETGAKAATVLCRANAAAIAGDINNGLIA